MLWRIRLRALLVVACASALVAGASGQAVAARTEPVGTNAFPAQWLDSGQRISNFYSGKCLQPETNTSQARVVQRTCTNGTNSLQRWKVLDAGDGHAMLRNGGGLCLDLFANSQAEVVPGTPVQVFSCSNGYPTEHWSRSAGSRTDHFQVRTHINGYCLDVHHRSTADGAPLQVFLCDYYETAQQFRFVDAPW